MPSKEISILLENKKTQLTKRIAAIEADFHKGRSQDFSEQATETEMMVSSMKYIMKLS